MMALTAASAAALGTRCMKLPIMQNPTIKLRRMSNELKIIANTRVRFSVPMPRYVLWCVCVCVCVCVYVCAFDFTLIKLLMI